MSTNLGDFDAWARASQPMGASVGDAVQVQHHDADHDQRQRDHLRQIPRLPQRDHPDNGDQRGAQAGPDRIGDGHLHPLHHDRQQPDRDGVPAEHEHRPQRVAEAVRTRQRGRRGHLQADRQHQQRDRESHVVLFRRVCSTCYTTNVALATLATKPFPDHRFPRRSGMTDRRQELAEAATDYVLEHGLIGLTLRPLAAAIGTSDRMLLYHFRDKADLLATVLTTSNDRSVCGIRALAPSPDVRRAVLDLWAAVEHPAHARYQRLYVEAAAIGVLGVEPYASLVARANEVWMDALAAHLTASG